MVFFAAGDPETSTVTGTYMSGGLINICRMNEWLIFFFFLPQERAAAPERPAAKPPSMAPSLEPMIFN